MILRDKVALIYGAGGAIGSAVARAFALQGANVFLTGRHLAPVEAVAKEIVSVGGSAEAAEVDALDEHLQSVIDKAGRVDISFNAVGIANTNILGVPLVELNVEQFSLPITAYATSYFLTARLAARRMLPNKSGVIMTVTALHSRTGIPLVGGYGPAMAAKEAHSGPIRRAPLTRPSRPPQRAVRHPLSTSRGGCGGLVAVGGVGGLVVGDAEAQAVPEDFQPAMSTAAGHTNSASATSRFVMPSAAIAATRRWVASCSGLPLGSRCACAGGRPRVNRSLCRPTAWGWAAPRNTTGCGGPS